MKSSKKFSAPSNQPINDSRFLPLMQHPNQVTIIEPSTPFITVWDRVDYTNAHDMESRHKRQLFDSVAAESKQLRKHKLDPGINSQTGVFPHSLSTPDTFFQLTLTFLPQRRPTA